jgi:hypothetical protein
VTHIVLAITIGIFFAAASKHHDIGSIGSSAATLLLSDAGTQNVRSWRNFALAPGSILGDRQPKQFGTFLTQSSHSSVTQSSTTRPGAGHE